MSLIVIFRHLPGDTGGAAIIIRNLFKYADEKVVIAGRKPRYTSQPDDVNYKKIELPLSDRNEGRLRKFKLFWQSVQLCLQEIRKNKQQKILGVYRDESSFILSFVISILSGRPLFAYMTDLYAENYNSRYRRLFQYLIFLRCTKIFCLNQSMKEHYINIGYKKVEVIPSTITTTIPFKKATYNGGVFRIVFSGSIVYDRLDMLQQLVSVIADRPEFELIFYSPQNEEFLKSNQLWASNVRREFLTNPADLLNSLQDAHLLYLPLTFAKPNDQRGYLQLKTCMGTKSYEYMQSGVPILVHSPAEYYTYQFFQEKSAAILLNSSDINDLRSMLNELRINFTAHRKVAEQAFIKLEEHQSLPNLVRLQKLMRLAN